MATTVILTWVTEALINVCCAIPTSPASRARASVVSHAVRTQRSLVKLGTRAHCAIVNVDFAVMTSVTILTRTAVFVNQIRARASMDARAGRTLVNVGFAVCALVAWQTRAVVAQQIICASRIMLAWTRRALVYLCADAAIVDRLVSGETVARMGTRSQVLTRSVTLVAVILSTITVIDLNVAVVFTPPAGALTIVLIDAVNADATILARR